MKPFTNRDELQSHQHHRLHDVVRAVRATNPFYAAKLRSLPSDWDTLALDALLRSLPYTHKSELVESQKAHPPYGNHLTFPLSRYTRCHQTSGTSGTPLRWLDTPESWAWMLGNWRRVFEAAGITTSDRLYFAFSFGPFLGFWTAFESATSMGCLCFPSGGLGTHARAQAILENGITALCCTPTYAIHLGETARKEGLPIDRSQVRRIVVAGEPGGSIPAVRSRIENLWPGARVSDHHGMTEIGPVSYECPAHPYSLHVMEEGFLMEIIDPKTLEPVAPEALGELVLTNLGRIGSPLLRYRTGDLVRSTPPERCACGSVDRLLKGGILGRTDDMVVVRGVNLFPSAVDEVIQSIAGIAEYQIKIHSDAALTNVAVLIESSAPSEGSNDLVRQVETRLRTAFSLRFEVALCPAGTLPRSEHKSRRWIRE